MESNKKDDGWLYETNITLIDRKFNDLHKRVEELEWKLILERERIDRILLT